MADEFDQAKHIKDLNKTNAAILKKLEEDKGFKEFIQKKTKVLESVEEKRRDLEQKIRSAEDGAWKDKWKKELARAKKQEVLFKNQISGWKNNREKLAQDMELLSKGTNIEHEQAQKRQKELLDGLKEIVEENSDSQLAALKIQQKIKDAQEELVKTAKDQHESSKEAYKQDSLWFKEGRQKWKEEKVQQLKGFGMRTLGKGLNMMGATRLGKYFKKSGEQAAADVKKAQEDRKKAIDDWDKPEQLAAEFNESLRAFADRTAWMEDIDFSKIKDPIKRAAAEEKELDRRSNIYTAVTQEDTIKKAMEDALGRGLVKDPGSIDPVFEKNESNKEELKAKQDEKRDRKKSAIDQAMQHKESVEKLQKIGEFGKKTMEMTKQVGPVLKSISGKLGAMMMGALSAIGGFIMAALPAIIAIAAAVAIGGWIASKINEIADINKKTGESIEKQTEMSADLHKKQKEKVKEGLSDLEKKGIKAKSATDLQQKLKSGEIKIEDLTPEQKKAAFDVIRTEARKRKQTAEEAANAAATKSGTTWYGRYYEEDIPEEERKKIMAQKKKMMKVGEFYDLSEKLRLSDEEQAALKKKAEKGKVVQKAADTEIEPSAGAKPKDPVKAQTDAIRNNEMDKAKLAEMKEQTKAMKQLVNKNPVNVQMHVPNPKEPGITTNVKK